MNENEILQFWNENPCGDWQVGGLSRHRGNYEAFFSSYDEFRYAKEAHILKCLDNIGFKEKRVLEIGLGQGADSEQIIRRGAIWSGLDLTPEAVDRVKARLSLRRLPHDVVKQGSVLEIPFEDASFDIVFSHGVLHHVPDIQRAQSEIRRVLKPTGELVVMLYAKWSLNYLLSISLIRRLGLAVMYYLKYQSNGIYRQHIENAQSLGIWKYLSMENFIHKNTDGPLNPYSKVYDLSSAATAFTDFDIVRSYKRFMHAPPLPVAWFPGARVLGWHLWVHLKPKSSLP